MEVINAASQRFAVKSQSCTCIACIPIDLHDGVRREQGNGSSNDPSPTPNNLSATSVKILDANGNPDYNPLLMVEHPFTVEIKIASATAVEGVAVDFFILDKGSLMMHLTADERLEEYFFVGTVFLENLRAGENVRHVDLSLPYTEWMEEPDNEGVVSTEYTG